MISLFKFLNLFKKLLFVSPLSKFLIINFPSKFALERLNLSLLFKIVRSFSFLLLLKNFNFYLSKLTTL